MKTVFTKMSQEQAEKEIKNFGYLSLVLGGLGMFLFWGLGIAGLAFGVRSLILTWNDGAKNINNLISYRFISGIGTTLSLLCLVLYFTK